MAAHQATRGDRDAGGPQIAHDPRAAIDLIGEWGPAGLAASKIGASCESRRDPRRGPLMMRNHDEYLMLVVVDDEEMREMAKAEIPGLHETKEQLEFLRAQGCDSFQGFLFAKPLTTPEVTALLKSQRAAA